MSTTIIAPAEIATVTIGTISLEGLMFEDGRFAIAIPQLEKLGLVPTNRSKKQLEALLGIAFQTHAKAKTKLHPNAVNTVGVDDVVAIIKAQLKRGNPQALILADLLLGLSLHQLLCDAFKIKFEAEERQIWLENRQVGKVTHRTHTDAIKAYLIRHPEKSDNYRIHIYANVADTVNTLVFGMTAKQLRQARNTTATLLRDTHAATDLQLIERIEDYAMRLMDKTDTEPMTAVSEAYEFYS